MSFPGIASSARKPHMTIAYMVMVITPLLFSTNVVFGRVTISEVAPFTLAFLRWTLCAVILSPFVIRSLPQCLRLVRQHPGRILTLGFLGMWVSGGGVYYSLQYTTATNGTMIYTTSPLIIILLERLLFHRQIRWREMVGIVVAFCGVGVILFQGRIAHLLSGSLNIGDLGFLIAACAWAGYSILFRDERMSQLPILALFGLVSTAGSFLLLPFAAFDLVRGAAMPTTALAWQGIAGIVVFSSLLAFSGFQFGLRNLGASVSGIFMYLLPVYGVVLAVVFLGEKLHTYHFAGIALVLGGVLLATFPVGRMRKMRVPTA
ncbi:MAG: DMT family transporter [Rhizobiaceae bacterium]|nr:DMT family transporter [Rhizobiaceae bacterium]